MLFRERIIEDSFKIFTDILMPDFIFPRQIRRNLRLKFRNFLYNHGPYYDKAIILGQEASNIIYEYLSNDKPCLICRFGGFEIQPLRNYYKNGIIIPKRMKIVMERNTGFFPATNNNLKKFGKMEFDLCKDIDILGCANWPGEAETRHKYCKNAVFVDINNICPIADSIPWSRCLEGKKVLVIHPFVESFKKQYAEKREVLFKNPDTLPQFELITYKAVQSIAGNKDLPYKDWFEALEKMENDISKIDFDIAIIGAGAYGIFLAHHCKKLGKKAVHMGGVTQMLFGVKGKRWLSEDTSLNDKINLEEFIFPNENERPKDFKSVEEGCYW